MSTASPELRGGGRPSKVGKSGRNKPRARLVCSSCRTRKVKCDAEKLATGQKCSHCEASGFQCVLDQADRRRRGRPSQQSTAALQDRIKYLESALRESAQVGSQAVDSNLQGSNAVTVDDSARVDTGRQSISSSLGVSPRAANPAPPPEATQKDGVNPTNERRPSFVEPVHRTIPDGGAHSQALLDTTGFCDAQSNLPGPSRSTLRLADSQPPIRTLDSTQNADATGALPSENGNPLDFPYYGPTTQPHIQSPSDGILAAGGEDDIAPSMPLNMDSLPLRKTLLNIYFKLQHRFLILVDEGFFMSGLSLKKRSQYYSEFLEDAILTFSSRHSTSSAVRKLGDKYAQRCKTRIGMELEDPKISSLQGLLLLGDFETTRGRARIGWTYCVIASGLMVDLGIHVDCSPLVKQGKLTALEAEARKSLLLTIFVFAAQWSLYLGRPNPMSQPTLRAVLQAAPEFPNVWVGYCTRMLDIVDILNSPASLSGFTRETSDRLLELNSELQSFLDSIQPNFSANDRQLEELDGELYSFHMQVSGLQIQLHRAILKSDQLARDSKGGDAEAHQLLSDSSRDHLYSCVHGKAIGIARLILSYQRIFGVDEIVTVMIDNIFIASFALISHIHRLNQQGKSAEQDVHWLHLLSSTLQAMGKHFPATARMRSYLARLAKDSALSSAFPPVADSSPSNLSENRFDIFHAQESATGISEVGAGDLLADVNPFNNSFDLMNLEFNGPLHFGSAWNMTPAMFDPMAQEF